MKRICRSLFTLPIFVLGVILTFNCCSEDTPQSEIISVDGLDLRLNYRPVKATVSGSILDLEDMLLIDGTGPGYPDEALIGNAQDVQAGPSGEIFVLDGNSPYIKQFDSEGQFIRTFGRRGSGPGEFQSPWRLPLLERDEISVAEAYTGRVVIFDLKGVYQRTLVSPFGHFTAIAPALNNQFILTSALSGSAPNDGSYGGRVLRLLNSDGEPDSFELETGPKDTLEIDRRLYYPKDVIGHRFTNRNPLLGTPGGSVLVAGANYTFYRITERGRMAAFRKVAEEVRFPGWWFDYWRGYYQDRGQPERMPDLIGYAVLPNSMAVDEHGHLWVVPDDGTGFSFASSYEELQQVNLVPIDEFDPDGRWLRKEILRIPERATYLVLTDAAGGFLYGFLSYGSGEEPNRVIRFKRPN